jgi:hypothetical protein
MMMMMMMMMQINCSSGVQSVLLCCANRYEYLVCKFVISVSCYDQCNSVVGATKF